MRMTDVKAMARKRCYSLLRIFAESWESIFFFIPLCIYDVVRMKLEVRSQLKFMHCFVYRQHYEPTSLSLSPSFNIAFLL